MIYLARDTTKLKRAIKKFFGFDVHEYQAEFVFDCLDLKRVVGVFCRQSGKSLSISFVSILEALRYPDRKILIIAPTDLQAGLLFDKISANLKNSILMAEVKSVTKRSALFNNGTTITAHTVGDTGASIRGLTGHVVILEEAAFIKDSIVSEVIMPMAAATDGKVIKISTPFGMNHFYESAMSDMWVLHQNGWQEPVNAGLITNDFIEAQKETMTSMQFRTEYGAEFIADQDAYFPSALIQSCIEDYPMIGGAV